MLGEAKEELEPEESAKEFKARCKFEDMKQTEAEEDRQSVGTASPRARLLDYVHQLTDYLPVHRRSDFNVSSNRLKIACLQARLAGQPGLCKGLGPKSRPAPSPVACNHGSVANAFSCLQDLASHHPNRDVGLSLDQRVGEVVRRLQSRTQSGENQNG